MAPLLLTLLLLFPAHAQQQSGVPGSTNGTGTNTCRYANDGECDEPDAGTGLCAAGSDTEDCDRANSCQFAHDGECDEPGTPDRTVYRCDSGTDSDDCCPPHSHSLPHPWDHRPQCACNARYRVDSSLQTCVPDNPPPPPSRPGGFAWYFAYPACSASMTAVTIAMDATSVSDDPGVSVTVGGDCDNHTTSCATNCQTLVSRMVSDCVSLEQALAANDTTMTWRDNASYVSFRTAILSGIPAGCVVESVVAEQQPEEPHRRANDDCSQIDNHASLLLVLAVVLACILCAFALCAAFACCKKKERTGHTELRGLLTRK